MSIFNELRRVDKKFLLTLIGVILTIVFGTFAIISLFYQSQPNINAEIINEANVLDVYKPVKDLNIFFQEEDINKENLNLRIFTIRFDNDGGVDILQSHYDRDDRFGVFIENGKIIEVRLVESNSDYIKDKLNPQIIENEDFIAFEKIIFERGKYFILEILTLHNRDELPKMQCAGKIAGIDKIIISKSDLDTEEQSYVSQLFAGDVLIQTIRLVSYTLAVFVIIVAVAVVVALILGGIDSRKKSARRVKIQKYFEREGIELDNTTELLFDLFINEGQAGLREVKVFLTDEGKLIRRQNEQIKTAKRAVKSVSMEDLKMTYMDEKLLGRYLIQKDIVKVKPNNEIKIHSHFMQLLNQILAMN